MTDHEPGTTHETGHEPTPEELQREIAETRERLGHTVDELSHKLDVKEQARLRVDRLRATGRARADDAVARVRREPVPVAALAAAVVAVVALVAWRRAAGSSSDPSTTPAVAAARAASRRRLERAGSRTTPVRATPGWPFRRA